MRLFLIGFMGCGKTYTGSRLAKQLNYPFVDLDDYIEAQTGKSISQLFDQEGEDGFRIIEKQALREMANYDEVVVSCGGGTPCFFDNMEWMKKHGKTIFLDLPPKLLEKRLIQGLEKRPLIKDLNKKGALLSFIASKLSDRIPFYHRADIIFNPDNETLPPWIALEHWILYG